MSCPTVLIIGKKIILLSGYKRTSKIGKIGLRSLKITEVKKLRQATSRHPDAVAFGHTAGRWLPAA